MTNRGLAVGVVIASIAFALSPLLTPGFAGYSPEQFPVMVTSPPVQPAGWAFGIWGLIYLWLIAGALWGLLKAADDPDWRAMRAPLIGSLAIGTFWVAVANVSPVWASAMIVVMAVLAVLAMHRAGTSATLWQVRPVALYAGWLTAATGVGSGVVLGGYGILSPQVSALVMLVAVLIVALFVQGLRPREWAYPLAVIWALTGVIAANLPQDNWPVIALSALGILALAGRFALLRARAVA